MRGNFFDGDWRRSASDFLGSPSGGVLGRLLVAGSTDAVEGFWATLLALGWFLGWM